MIGKYIGQYGYNLTLNMDNTFQYKYLNGWYYEHILVYGKWEHERDYLFLNGIDTLMEQSLPLHVEESIVSGDSVLFILDIPQINEYVNWTLVLNRIPIPFNNDSIVSIVLPNMIEQFYLKAEKNTLVVPLINRETIQTYIYIPIRKNSNLFTISIPLSGKDIYHYASYEPINDTLIIKKNKLIWPRKSVVLKFQKR
jgi:hypothetical protein